MILAKMAQSTKKATTPTIHTTNNSVTILFKIWCKGTKSARYINIRCKKVFVRRSNCCKFRNNPYLCTILQNETAMNYDSNPVHLLYNNEELRDRINMVMDSRDHTTGITFVNLCYQLIQVAFQENKVKKLDDNTTITSEELAPEEQVRVSRILWELIWDHKIFLLFGRSELLGLSNGEDRFVKY